MNDEDRIRMADAYARTLNSPDGRVMFEDLSDKFLYPELYVPGDPGGSHVRIGEANVIRHCQGILAVAANPKVLSVVPPSPPDDDKEAA